VPALHLGGAAGAGRGVPAAEAREPGSQGLDGDVRLGDDSSRCQVRFAPTPAVEKLIREHFDYTEKLRASGRLVYAGAIEGTGDLRGVLVMQGDSAAIARAMKEDPAVRAGRFASSTLRWWTAWGTIPGH